MLVELGELLESAIKKPETSWGHVPSIALYPDHPRSLKNSSVVGKGVFRRGRPPASSIFSMAANVAVSCLISENGSEVRPGAYRLTVRLKKSSRGSQTSAANLHFLGSTNAKLIESQEVDVGISSNDGRERRTDVNVARSATHFVNPPGVKNVFPAACTPVMSTAPTVTLRLYKASRVAGHTTDPSVSVPTEQGAKPAATPTALPEDDPPGVYSSVSTA